MEDKIKKTKDADIHIRCYPEDKMFVEDRSKNGFGRGASTMTNFVIYALRHVDDASPIDLNYVDNLMQSISSNRSDLASAHQTIANIPHELNAIGKNINQVAKAVNTVMLKARKNGETNVETIAKLMSFQNSLIVQTRDLSSIMDKYNNSIKAARITINAVLRKEDELLTRCLVFPEVGNRYHRLCQLMRMIKDYQKESGVRNDWSVDTLKETLQKDIDSAKKNL